MNWNSEFEQVYPTRRVKIVGFVTGIPIELDLIVNVDRVYQLREVEEFFRSGTERTVNGAFGQYTVGDNSKTLTTEEGYTVKLNDITAWRVVKDV